MKYELFLIILMVLISSAYVVILLNFRDYYTVLFSTVIYIYIVSESIKLTRLISTLSG